MLGAASDGRRGLEPEDAVARLAALIGAARSVVALTGAGISVPSGIPDFRTPVTGLWANVDPMKVAHIDAFHRDPAEFWRFYGERFARLEGKQPNGAHLALVELERRGLLAGVITQNIDMLHRAAGTQRLLELHGSIAQCVCLRCDEAVALAEARARLVADEQGIPRCGCGRPLKPGVVLFGEMLPEAELDEACELCFEADVLLCVGSSLEVHPVAGLPQLTLRRGGRLGLITQGPTSFDDDAAVKLDRDVVADLEALVRALGG